MLTLFAVDGTPFSSTQPPNRDIHLDKSCVGRCLQNTFFVNCNLASQEQATHAWLMPALPGAVHWAMRRAQLWLPAREGLRRSCASTAQQHRSAGAALWASPKGAVAALFVGISGRCWDALFKFFSSVCAPCELNMGCRAYCTDIICGQMHSGGLQLTLRWLHCSCLQVTLWSHWSDL